MNDKLLRSSAAFVLASDIPLRSRYDELKWNGWTLDGFELGYRAYPGGGVYPIDLREFTQSSAMLNMIMQVAHKDWATDACIAGLVHALDHILQPQAHLCSCGGDKRMTSKELHALVKRMRSLRGETGGT